jgi:hypothetical protein
MDLTVCERWNLHLNGHTGQGWFLDWVRREPEQVSRHLTAGLMAYASLQMVLRPGEIRTAREYFGGVGAQSLMISDSFQPERHVVLDNSAEAAAWLREGLSARGVLVHQADSYAPASVERADLVGLDFGDLTAWRLRPGQKHRDLLDRVFAGRPAAVVLTDIAGPRLHLHRERYSEVLHTRPEHLRSYARYLEGLADWMRAHYGYALVRGYYQRWSAVLALVPAVRLAEEGHLVPVPDRPRGLEIL